MDQRGLDERRRGTKVRVSERQAQTPIWILRKLYGAGFARGESDSATLKTVLHKLPIGALAELYAHLDDGSLDARIKAAAAPPADS